MDNVTQFGRSCELIVGSEGLGLSIRNLRMTFDIVKSSDDKSNTAKIEVYNLSPEHQSQIIKEWNDIKLMAGYKGNERLIFQGQIRTAIPRVSGTDRIVTIECGDGDREILKGFINRTLEAGSTADDVVNECQKAMFDVKASYKDNLLKMYSRGRVLSGRASDILTEQCKSDDAQWSIQDGQLVLLKGGNVIPNAAWLISQDTGMLGSPEPTTDGVKVKTLLNPAYMIGGVAKVDSLIFGGAIRIEKLIHRGDTHEGEWASELEGLRI